MSDEKLTSSPENIQWKNVQLVEANEEMAAEFLAMAAEFKAHGDNYYEAALENFTLYFERLTKFARGVGLEPHQVRENQFWLVDNGRIVAASRLRHTLNPMLEIMGGHIGYNVSPRARRKGYGTLLLKLTLEKAKDLGLEKVFLTCDTDNTGSAKVIENNGGKLAGYAIWEATGKEISQYWIEIGKREIAAKRHKGRKKT